MLRQHCPSASVLHSAAALLAEAPRQQYNIVPLVLTSGRLAEVLLAVADKRTVTVHHSPQVALGLAALLLVQVLLAGAAHHHLAAASDLVPLGRGLRSSKMWEGNAVNELKSTA